MTTENLKIDLFSIITDSMKINSNFILKTIKNIRNSKLLSIKQ
jgi:hypothetical protein